MTPNHKESEIPAFKDRLKDGPYQLLKFKNVARDLIQIIYIQIRARGIGMELLVILKYV